MSYRISPAEAHARNLRMLATDLAVAADGGDPSCDRCRVARGCCAEHDRRRRVAAGEPRALAQLDRMLDAEDRRASAALRRHRRLGGGRLGL